MKRDRNTAIGESEKKPFKLIEKKVIGTKWPMEPKHFKKGTKWLDSN